VRVFSCPPRAPLALSLTQMHAKFARTEAAFSMSLETCVFYSNSPFVCFCSFVFFLGFCRKRVSGAGVKDGELFSLCLCLCLSRSVTQFGIEFVFHLFSSHFALQFFWVEFFFSTITFTSRFHHGLQFCFCLAINTHLRSSFPSVSNSCLSLYIHIHI